MARLKEPRVRWFGFAVDVWVCLAAILCGLMALMPHDVWAQRVGVGWLVAMTIFSVIWRSDWESLAFQFLGDNLRLAKDNRALAQHCDMLEGLHYPVDSDFPEPDARVLRPPRRH